MKNFALKALTLSITDGKHGDCKNEENSGYYFISCKDIKDGNILYENARQITKEDFIETHKRTKLERDDILVTNSGTIGRMAFVTDTEKASRTTFQKSVAILKPNKEKVIPLYLYYSIKANIDSLAGTANGAAQKNLLLSTMRDFNITIHTSFSKQSKIVSILSTYDELIENNKKQIKLLEEAAQRLYKEWFVDLRFPGHENVPVVDGVPEGWERRALETCSSVLRRGISPKYSDNAFGLVINQKCIRSSIMDIREARKQEKMFSDNMNLRNNDTVICSTGAGTLGRVGQVFGEFPNTTFDSHVTLVRANDVIGKQYLFHFLKSKQPFLQCSGKGSTNQIELSKDIIADLKIALPDTKLIEKFESLAQPIHDKITTLTLENLKLEEQRNYLLPKLMSGEIEV